MPLLLLSQKNSEKNGRDNIEYQRQEHSKFSLSQIKVVGNKVILDNLKTIEFPKDIEAKHKLILTTGLLDPYQINGKLSIKICCIEELVMLNQNPQIKRFKFWIFPLQQDNTYNSESEKFWKNRINPSEYSFELDNLKANENTTFEEFISDAKLIFISSGKIVI